jgi:cysteinyl-tRNA synthetase
VHAAEDRPAEIEARIADRVAARGARDFARADEIRASLKGRGVELMDTPSEPPGRRAVV